MKRDDNHLYKLIDDVKKGLLIVEVSSKKEHEECMLYN